MGKVSQYGRVKNYREKANANVAATRNKNGKFVRIINGVKTEITRSELLRCAMRRIAAQFPQTPEARLMLAVIQNAVSDTLIRQFRPSAIRFLKGEIWPAMMCGVNPEWIRETLEEVDCFDPL